MKYRTLLGVAVTVAVCSAGLAQEPISVPAGQRQLFLDDHGIAKLENLERTMHQPVKWGAVIRGSAELDIHAPQTRMAPAWDPAAKVYKIWTAGSTPADLHAKRFYTSGYFESADGLHWTTPVLNQVEYKGSRANNLFSLLIDGRQLNVELAVYDAAEPDPARRYKWAVPNFGFLVSADGKTWKKLDAKGIPSADEYNLSFDEHGRLFILTVKVSGPHGRSVGLATSKDFQSWTNHGLIFHADEEDQKRGRANIKAWLSDPALQQPLRNTPEVYNVDVYNMGLFRYEGLYIGLPAMYHAVGRTADNANTVGFHLVQLICSRDLKNWKRLGDRQPFLRPSPKGAGAYDLTQIIGPSAPVMRGDELWFYYTGLKYRDRIEKDSGAICLAVLRRDGFISLDAGKEPGTLLTKPFVMNGSKLSVNVDALEGALDVSLLDGAGKTVAVSEPIVGNKLRATVQWKSGNLASHEGRPMSLRFTLRNARFYSFWCDK